MRGKISFAGPWITQKEIDYVNDAVVNGWYENFSIHIEKLQKSVCEYLGRKYAIATHCCTHALHLACAASGFKSGDEIICPDFSWVATAYAISYTGAKPVFVDIDSDSWCIDPEKIREAITEKTRGIMLVHTFGHPCRMDEIMEIAKENDLKVIEDAAPSMGSNFKGQKTGTFGDAGCFSFQGAKIAVSGEGGVMVTDDKQLYEKATLLASMGRTDSNAVFWSDMLGYQYTMPNLTAALALAQVERIDELVEKKREIFNWYQKRLNGNSDIKLISECKDCYCNYCYPSILLGKRLQTRRDEIIKKLKEKNIHARPGFPQMSKFPVYEERYENPQAMRAWMRGVSLPSAANLTEEDIEFTCETLKELIR
jgi:perosamine synthetase